MDTTRCIDLAIGQKVLSYDLLDGEEKRAMDEHLEVCVACRDFRQQLYGKQGALDDLNMRAWRLSRRQRVEASWWIAQRLRDLWLPFMAVLAVVVAVGLYIANRGPERTAVRILHFAVSRGATLDSTVTPRVDAGPNALILRTNREARAYVYEVRQGTMRRILPPEGQPAPHVGPDETREVPLPELEDHESRLVLVLVPGAAPGTTEDWDAAAFVHLGQAKSPEDVGHRGWPGGVRPTVRWCP